MDNHSCKSVLFNFFVVIQLINGLQHQTDWRPIQPIQPDIYGSLISEEYQHAHSGATSNQCEVFKVGFTQDLYFQYVKYKTDVPDLKEFTLCFWSKFSNHSNDHPLFSYAVDGQPRAIYSWIANTERSSYFSMAVEGHTFYRLNYPLRLNKWYHTCQSWNGKTGEWQIWVNAERVGRGFHNRLVGSKIPGGGVAISGQSQTQVGGGFQEGKDAPKGSGGMLGEITMVQLYNVALTAGKAHKDHKHHHAHQFDHNGMPITTTPKPTPAPQAPQPMHPLLTAGQLNPMLRLNFANGQTQLVPVPGQNYNAQYVNGQFIENLVAKQIQSGKGPQAQFSQTPIVIPGLPQQQQPQFSQSPVVIPELPQHQQQQTSFQSLQTSPENDQILIPVKGGSFSTQQFSFGDQPLVGANIIHSQAKRDTRNKRQVLLAGGTILDGSLGSGEIFSQSLLNGLAGIGDNQPVLQEQKMRDEREPAEAEVKAVMNVCSGCDEEPFEKALVFGWRTVPKKLYSGAFYMPATPQCKAF